MHSLSAPKNEKLTVNIQKAGTLPLWKPGILIVKTLNEVVSGQGLEP